MTDAPAGPDTIRILVATDNHVGFNETDPIRGDDSARTFDEIMSLAKEKTVDMVLLAGDLFHENKPSRKAMNAVLRSLRMNCFGDKPCELEMLSDPTEHFDATFDHVNYEDPDINVSIPVFSIHGNHDDPSGEGHLSALDLLQTCGLINYYGRTPESDNILIKPVLLQKGRTKLALYGMSNVRDERLHRTFRDGKVKFYRPNAQKDNWFNLMSVHQNHHAYTETGYLPENFLPEFLNLVIWGHEHECLINPRFNPEMSFDVMQPGSSVATSLMSGEAGDKHVALIEVTGQEYESTPIRLKSVRPFVMKEIVLLEEKGMKLLAKKDNNRLEITRHLSYIVEELIEEAKKGWDDLHGGQPEGEEEKMPLPLIRLRVEYSAPEGCKFDCENPQRFSNRFAQKVANTNDVIQYYKKKTAGTRKTKDDIELPEEASLARHTIDTIKVDKLVEEFLRAQPMNVLASNVFGDAVSQFVDKDDKHAMELFVNQALDGQIQNLLLLKEETDQEQITDQLTKMRKKTEADFASRHYKRATSSRLKPKPAHWDSDLDGEWADQPAALELSEGDDMGADDSEQESVAPRASGAAKKRANVSGSRKAPSALSAATKSRAAPAKGARGRKKISDAEDEDDEDVIMIDDDEEEDDVEEAANSTRRNARIATKTAPKRKVAAPKKTSARPTRAASRQTLLSFSQPASQREPVKGSSKVNYEISDDEISDDDDAFEPNVGATSSRARR